MKRVFRWIVPLLILLLLGLPANAQFGAQDVIVLQPFAIESFDLQGLRPAGWRENQPDSGVYLRFRDPTDRTAIMMQSIEADAQTMLERLQTTFNLAELPAIAETIEANNLSWNLYEFTHQQGNLTLFGALALTQNDERTYFC